MDILMTSRTYLSSLLHEVKGMKILRCDKETTQFVSLVFFQSQILDYDVFLVEPFSKPYPKPLASANCICFIRPTKKNIDYLSNELSHPLYQSYYIYFTNFCSDSQLSKLAEADVGSVVRSVKEFYCDYQAINEKFFNIAIPSCLPLLRNKNPNFTHGIQNRIADSLIAMVMSCKQQPIFRWAKNSVASARIVKQLTALMERQPQIFNFNHRKNVQAPTIVSSKDPVDPNSNGGKKPKRPATCSSNPVFLILDRRDDPLTPLLTPWTYQAMIHHYLGIENNVVDFSNIPDVTMAELSKKVVFAPNEFDPDYEKFMFLDYKQVSDGVRKLVNEFTRQRQALNVKGTSSIADLKKFVEKFPQFKRTALNSSKHATVSHEFSRLIEKDNVFKLSALEQSLACDEAHSEHVNQIRQAFAEQKNSTFSLLRIVLLYSLRYEKASSKQLVEFKRMLGSRNCPPGHIELLDTIIQYAGRSQRTGDILKNKSLATKAFSMMKSLSEDVKNTYMRFRPLMSILVENLFEKKLSLLDYPIQLPPVLRSTKPTSLPAPSDVVVFYIGGATYSEAREARALSSGEKRVVLGASQILGCKEFIRQLMEYQKKVGSAPSNSHSFV